jgi:hypothetical protein
LNETLHIFGGVFMADCNAQESSLLWYVNLFLVLFNIRTSKT